MTKKGLKVGYVVEIENQSGTNLAMICECGYCGLCVSGENNHYPLSCVGDDLKYGREVITKVYGYSYNTCSAYKLSTEGRNLLWERPTYYNGKVVCVEGFTGLTTKGKIYNFVDGRFTYDNGSKCLPCKDFEDVCRSFTSKFIEVVE